MRVSLFCRALAAMIGLFFFESPLEGKQVYDLQHVDGIESFGGSEQALGLLAKNGFVVAAPEFRQIFEPYIESPLPVFITPDSAWHTYHFLLEQGVKEMEQLQSEKQRSFSRLLLNAAQEQASNGTPEFQELADYASIGLAFQDTNHAASLTDDQKRMVEALVSGTDPVRSPIGFALLPRTFRPQSFYTESPELAAYYQAHQWYASVDFRLTDDHETHLALCLSWLVHSRPELLALWHELSEPYDTFVALPEDGTVTDYLQVTTDVLTTNFGLAELKKGKAEILKRLRANPKLPRINDQWLSPEEFSRLPQVTAGFRLLPARQLPCTICLQDSADPNIPGRFCPSGLDFFAASAQLRSPAALRAEEKQVGKAVLTKVLAADPGPMPDSLYGQSMELLTSLQKPLPVGVPAPFRTEAWSDLQLWTQLGAWAEQRHTWALYSKPNGEVSGIAETPPGIVAPYPQFFAGLANLSRRTAIAMQTNHVGTYLTNFAAICDRVAELAAKELAGKIPTAEDAKWIAGYGEALGYFRMYEGNSWEVPEDDFPIVSRIFGSSAGGSILYAGVARPQALYVILPYKDRKQLYRGAVMSYREFERPEKEKLDDEAWRNMVRDRKAPAAPSFTASFMHSDQPDAGQSNRIRELSFAEDDLAKPQPAPIKLKVKQTVLSPAPTVIRRGIENNLVSSDDERHVLYVEKTGGKSRVVHDGIADKEHDTVGFPTFSPDSGHVAYVAEDGGSSCVVRDGVEGKHYREIGLFCSQEGPFAFSSNGVHFAYEVISSDRKERVVVDGLEGPEFDRVVPGSFSFSENSAHFAYAGVRGENVCVLKDNKEVLKGDAIDEGRANRNQDSIILSPDGERLACVVKHGSEWFVNIDGTNSKPWTQVLIDRWSGFSPDGRHFTYLARADWAVYTRVLDAEEFKHGMIEGVVFSENGKSWVTAQEDETGSWVTVNGRPGKKYRGGILELTFSPDGKRLGYLVEGHFGGSRPAAVIHGEQEFEDVEPALFTGIKFSPDSRHFAITGKRGQKGVVIIDGKQYPSSDNPDSADFCEVTFSPNSERWAYRAFHGDKQYRVISGIEYGPYGAAPDPDREELQLSSYAEAAIHFSPDSRHFVFRVTRESRHYLVVDGVEREMTGEWFPDYDVTFDTSKTFHFLMMDQRNIYLTEVEIGSR